MRGISTSQPRFRPAWARAVVSVVVVTCLGFSLLAAGALAHERHSRVKPNAMHHRRHRLAHSSRKRHSHGVTLSKKRQSTASRKSSNKGSGLGTSIPLAGGSGVTGPNGASSSGAGDQGGSGSVISNGTGSGGPSPSEGTAVTGEPSESPVSGGNPTTPFEMGLVAGSALMFERPFVRALGAHTARLEVEIGTPASQIAPIVEAYAQAGVKPLLLASFDGTLPSTAEAESLAEWAKAFGPDGTLWQGKSLPAGTAVTDIEFGNETSYAYQYPDTSKASNWYDLPSYAARAQTYALRLEAAQTAIAASGAHVGLLAQADDGGSGASTWVDNMFAAVPDLAERVAGWTVHPYGPHWQTRIDKLVSSTAAHGAPGAIPIYVTEWGLATDNGRCLSDNYGWNACMTYTEAASTLSSTMSAMRARYGARLAAFYLYQAHDQAASGASTDRESYFGALQSDEAPKGAYTTTVETLLSANP